MPTYLSDGGFEFAPQLAVGSMTVKWIAQIAMSDAGLPIDPKGPRTQIKGL